MRLISRAPNRISRADFVRLFRNKVVMLANLRGRLIISCILRLNVAAIPVYKK